ncbi:hypothetical protein WJX74_003806 [Apatococcus lobatus]|uniref:Uncharacterized protein n=1 Tax=Apatococcus lobatus TaxID=904363 RepID=A0AAW1RH86_9CHLO
MAMALPGRRDGGRCPGPAMSGGILGTRAQGLSAPLSGQASPAVSSFIQHAPDSQLNVQSDDSNVGRNSIHAQRCESNEGKDQLASWWNGGMNHKECGSPGVD